MRTRFSETESTPKIFGAKMPCGDPGTWKMCFMYDIVDSVYVKAEGPFETTIFGPVGEDCFQAVELWNRVWSR